jgi:hypothetical protein
MRLSITKELACDFLLNVLVLTSELAKPAASPFAQKARTHAAAAAGAVGAGPNPYGACGWACTDGRRWSGDSQHPCGDLDADEARDCRQGARVFVCD